jgi:enamine deaminase RidA (YjgF/YER057c/UK114 family)
MSAEAQLTQLAITLPPAPPKGGIYKPVVITGNLAYLSGHGPFLPDGDYITGKVGSELSLDEARQAARQTGLAMLATLRDQLGSLDRIKQVVKLLGMVNATPDFGQHPQVINGCSELFAQVFGDEAGIGVCCGCARCSKQRDAATRAHVHEELVHTRLLHC